MTLTPAKNPAAVLDACFAVGLCAREADKFATTVAKLQAYAAAGWEFHAPNAFIGEVLYVLCKKVDEGSLLAYGLGQGGFSWTS